MEQTIRTVKADVGISAHQDTEVSQIGTYLSYRLRTLLLPIILRATFGWQRSWQKLDQVRFNANRTSTWTTTAMRCATGLMQVKVDNVEAHITWSRDTHDGIRVGTIVVQLSTDTMDQTPNLGDIGIEKAQCIRIRQHNGRNVRSMLLQNLFKALYLDTTSSRISLDLDDLIIG